MTLEGVLVPITPEQAEALVKSLHGELVSRRHGLEKFDAYYRGEHPLQFASDEFREAFGGLFSSFSDNWCGVVVDAVAERLEVVGFRAGDTRDADRASWDRWRSLDLDSESNLAFLDALALSRSFGLVWAGDDGTEATFEHPTQAIVGYVPGSKRRKAALKNWRDDDYEYATLYTADELWKFQRLIRTVTGAVDSAAQWQPREIADEPWPLQHDLGVVPMIELQNRPRLGAQPRSEIDSVISVQDVVNLLWSHLVTASDFAAFPQRMVLGADKPVEPIFNDAGEVVGERPVPVDRFRVSRMGWLEDPDARLAEWAAADLSNYTKVIDLAVQHIAAQTKTPPDYLLGSMVNISGDALTAAERGLVSKVVDRQNNFSGGLREMMRLVHLADGNADLAVGIAAGRVAWKDPQYRTESEHVDALMKMKALGVPDEAIWERIPGVDQTEIERWKAMQADGVTRALGGDFTALLGPKATTA